MSVKRQGSEHTVLRQVRGARSVPGAAVDGDVEGGVADQGASRTGGYRCCRRSGVRLTQRFVRHVPVCIMPHFNEAFGMLTSPMELSTLWLNCSTMHLTAPQCS